MRLHYQADLTYTTPCSPESYTSIKPIVWTRVKATARCSCSIYDGVAAAFGLVLLQLLLTPASQFIPDANDVSTPADADNPINRRRSPVKCSGERRDVNS